MAVPLVFAWVLLLPYLLYRLLRVGKREAHLPPGVRSYFPSMIRQTCALTKGSREQPPTKPVLGNLTDIPPVNAHFAFAKMAAEYGKVFSLKLFGSTMVVLNDAKSVKEILDVRANISSNRPPAFVVSQYITQNNHLLLVDGQRAAHMKAKLYNRALTPTKVDQYKPILDAEVSAVLYNILNAPDTFYTEIRRLTASFTLAFAYGKRAPVFDKPDASGFSCARFFEVCHKLNAMLEPGATIPIDLLPWLKRIPVKFQGWQGRADIVKSEQSQLYLDCLYKDLLDRMAKGKANECWMKELVQDLNKGGLPFDEKTVSWSGGVMIEGGSDTSSSALLTIILAAVLHPEEVEKCQAEIDSVTHASSRSPTAEDIDFLPYTTAFIQEAGRWRPVANNAVPHYTTADQTYEGKFIPAGTILIQNNWAILHDEELFAEPNKFNPQRFIDHPYGFKNGASDENWRATVGFGSGRRFCGGHRLAQQTLNIAVPKLFWAFNFHKAVDATGNLVSPSPDDFIPGHLAAPQPFSCRITPRSDAHAEVIQRDYAHNKHIYDLYDC